MGEESGGQSLQSDVPAREVRGTLRTLRQVGPCPAVSAQVVALLALPDLARRPQLLLAEAAEELSEDLVLQPGGAEVAAEVLRDQAGLLPPPPPLPVLQPPLLLLADGLRLLARNPLRAAGPSLAPPLVSLQSFLLLSVLPLLAEKYSEGRNETKA